MPLPPLTELEPRQILLIKPSALGDVVHALPVLSALRRRYPAARIDWAINRVYEPLLVGHPELNATVPFDRGALKTGWIRGTQTWISYFRTLRAAQYDLVVDLQGLLRSGLMSLATRAPRRIGLAGAREGARFAYTDLLPDPGRQGEHAVDRYWRIAHALGAGEGQKVFRLSLAADARAWADEIGTGFPRPWLALGAGSRWITKRWPPEHFLELARRTQAQYGGTVFLVGTPDEAPLNAVVRQGLQGPGIDLTGKTSLPQLAALLARVDLMLANDTGPLHLAVALGRAVVAPYTCTRSALTGPYGQGSCVVETQVWCAGSYRRQCDRLECMTELTPDRLWPVLREVLGRWQTQKESA